MGVGLLRLLVALGCRRPRLGPSKASIPNGVPRSTNHWDATAVTDRDRVTDVTSENPDWVFVRQLPDDAPSATPNWLPCVPAFYSDDRSAERQ